MLSSHTLTHTHTSQEDIEKNIQMKIIAKHCWCQENDYNSENFEADLDISIDLKTRQLNL
jgi:hypothetical protein